MVDIIGRAKVIAETVVDEQQAKKAGKKAGDAAADGVSKGGEAGGKSFSSGFEGVIGKSLPLAAVGVGAAVGTVLATQIGKSLERESAGAKLAASLGGDASDAAELNKSAAKIYREAWGASFADVQKGVAATKSSFRELNGDELTEAARSAQIFADIFGVDVVQAAGVASIAVKQGLAADAVEAFDLMTKASQQVPIQFRGDLLDAIEEYSSFFQSIGIDGPEAFALLAEGAAMGQYGIDKIGDSIKEFQIRAIDTSATTSDAFQTLGLDIEEMQTAIANGGDEAEYAFRKIVEAIAEIEDPAEQAQTALALFGTPLEDLSQDELPAFIDALARGNRGLRDYKGATEDAGEVSVTASDHVKGWARTLDVVLGDALSKAIDGIKDYIRWHKEATDQEVTGLDVPDAPDVSQPRSTRASGGPVRGLALVGENGPELAQFGDSGGYVYNNSQTRDILAAATGDTYNNIFNITGPTSLAELRQQADWYNTYGTRFGGAT